MSRTLLLFALLIATPALWGANISSECLEAMRSVFGTAPKKLAEAIRKGYLEGIEDQDKFKFIYGERYLAGDDHAKRLVKDFGFVVREYPGGHVALEPPQDISLIFQAFRNRVQGWVKDGTLKEDEALEPAFVYKKKGNWLREFFGGTSYLFVRPGIDPWPDPKIWKRESDSHQLPHADFYSAVAEGKIPLAMGGFLAHDLAHLTELIGSPEIMKGWRAYGRWVAQDPHRIKQDSTGSPTTAELRSYILAEFLSVPDVRQAAKIKELWPQYFEPGAPLTLVQATARLANETPESRRQRAQLLLDRAGPLLLRHGGGLRDPYNMARYVNPASIRDRALTGAKRKEWAESYDKLVLHETLHAELTYLRYLVELRYEPDKRGHAARNENLDGMISESAARLELALVQVVRLNITADDIHRAARTQEPDPKSPVFQYFQSTSRPNSVTWYAFALGRTNPN